jgi:hypothetical protein
MSVYRINDLMYEQDIRFIFNTTPNQLRGYLKQQFGYNRVDDDSDGTCIKLYTKGYPVKYVIWLEKFEWLIYQYGILSHEVFHCVHFILDDLGFRLCDESVEAYCYYYQRIFQECINGLLMHVKKGK